MVRVGVLGGILLCFLATCLMVGGCGQSTSSTSSTTTTSTVASGIDESQRGVTEIEDQLRSALYQLQPENLGIDSRLDDATSVLNNWWAAVQAAKLNPTGVTPAEIPADRIDAALLASLQRETFNTDDGRYIRSCYLARRISDHLVSETTTELERISRVFEWVCRNVALHGPSDSQYPVTFYETLILGRGMPQDRASAMALILKQLRIDCVVLTPAATKESDAPWLLGIILQDDVYLFDPRLGLPIPRGDLEPSKQFAMPATLRELREHPDWLGLLTTRGDQPYALTAEDLTSLRGEAVTFPASWSHRVWALEQLLPGESLCVLYDPPSELDQLPGVFARVASVLPDAKPEDVLLWEHPQQQEAGFRKLDPAAVRALETDLTSLVVPIEVQFDKETQQSRSVETMRQLRIRTEQLSGNRGDAVSQYITIRQLSVTPPPHPNFGPVYQRAADDAFYWSSVCKFESGEYESAERLLLDYLKRFRRGGRWAFDARKLLSETYVGMGKIAEAIKTLSIPESGDPYRERHAILLKAWSAGQSESVTEPQ